MDKDTIIKEIQKVKGLVTLEEHNLPGGFGSAILELLQENNIQMPVLRIGLEDGFATHGNVNTLRDVYGLTPQKVAQKIKDSFDLEKNYLKKLVINFSRRSS